MRLLITGAGTPLADAAAAHLADTHDVSRTAFPDAGAAGPGVLPADLCDPDAVAPLLDGAETVLHFAPYAPEAFPGDTDAARLNAATLGTYTLMSCAREAGVARTIVAGTLRVFDPYPEQYAIDEGWRPRPKPVIGELIPYLCELACREFAREEREVVLLRFGELSEETSVQAALLAIDQALSFKMRHGRRFELAHVADNSTRFSSRALARLLDPEWRRRR